MLGAILVILTLIAGAAYVAKVGTGFTLLFIGAIVFMAYKRLPLIAFTVVFTLLLAGYTYIAPPAGIWKGFLWVLLAAGALVLGDPDDALKQAKSWESIGVDQLVFGIGPAPLEETLRTIRLLGEHVIPKVDTNPEHRTSQFRKAAAGKTA